MHREGMDDRVGLEHRLGVDPRARGIDDRDAREHVRLVDPIAQRRRRGSQLDSRVHTLRLHWISSLVHGDTFALRDEDARPSRSGRARPARCAA